AERTPTSKPYEPPSSSPPLPQLEGPSATSFLPLLLSKGTLRRTSFDRLVGYATTPFFSSSRSRRARYNALPPPLLLCHNSKGPLRRPSSPSSSRRVRYDTLLSLLSKGTLRPPSFPPPDLEGHATPPSVLLSSSATTRRALCDVLPPPPPLEGYATT